MAKRRAKGEGSIFYSPSDGRWKAQLYLPDGTRKGKSAKTQAEVRDWLIEERRKLKEGLFIADDQIKVGTFLDRYMKEVAVHSLRQTTYLAHSNIVKHHIKSVIGNIRLTSLRPDHVQGLYSRKLNEGLSNRTVQYIHAILHKALDQALKWGLVNKNVTDLVEKPRSKKKSFKTWSPDEVKKFLSAVEDHQWYPVYLLAVYTGLRQGEILGLHKDDLDLDNGKLHVRHQVTYIRGKGLIITEPKTKTSRRPVTLPDSVIQYLKNYLRVVEGDLVFTTRSGKPIFPRNIVRHFKSVIEAEGLPDIRFHDLRHTHATLLLSAGVHPKVVQERLGHSQISLTLDTYSHVIPSLQTEAAEQLEEMLS